MDYVNMREFPSSRSRCHSQIAFPTGSNRILNDHHRLTNINFFSFKIHCYSNTLYIMSVLHECYDKNFTMITTSDSNQSSSLSSIS
ncbi:hypothetical protein T05_11032 [Trichinella murrelli]|uniref:Uncharacterized protein n=2 Tax=Trichinella murrelli TaxID=144512 RepID=A0A0V0U024_9BILA|nr:hypothetical protein T05_11032 [Trichinella murrelli]